MTGVREAWWCACTVVGWVAPVAGLACLVIEHWQGAAISYFIAHASTVLRPGSPV